MYLPAQLKKIRQSLNMTTLEFSRACKLSLTTIIRLENDLNLAIPAKITWNKINMFLTRVKYFENHGRVELTPEEMVDPREGRPMITPPITPGIQTRWVPLNHQPQENRYVR